MPAVALLIRPFLFPPVALVPGLIGVFLEFVFFLFLSPSLLFFPRLPFHHTLAA